MKNSKHIYPRIGQPIICPTCEVDRRFGYGPCSNCGHTPNKAAVDAIRSTGIWIDPVTGILAAAPDVRGEEGKNRNEQAN